MCEHKRTHLWVETEEGMGRPLFLSVLLSREKISHQTQSSSLCSEAGSQQAPSFFLPSPTLELRL